MKKELRTDIPIMINKERDLRKNIRAINSRLNEHPTIARLILINPILALEEIGITLSTEVKQHIMDSLRFPPGWTEKRDAVKNDLEKAFIKYAIQATLPLTNSKRAHILFKVMQIKPKKEDNAHVNELAPERLPAYRKQHPLIDKMIEYERLKRGRLLFQPKETFEAYKSGERQLKWIKSIRFKV